VNYVVKELSIGQCVAPLRCKQKTKIDLLSVAEIPTACPVPLKLEAHEYKIY